MLSGSVGKRDNHNHVAMTLWCHREGWFIVCIIYCVIYDQVDTARRLVQMRVGPYV